MKLKRITLAALLAIVFLPVFLYAAEGVTIPSLNLGVKQATNPEEVVGAIQILFILTILALAPSIMIMVTAFTRIVVVLGFLRQAMGTQQMPPNQVIVGLSLFLTFFIMSPVINRVNTEALKPYYAEQISGETAMTKAIVPVKEFMLKQVREKDLALFIKLPRSRDRRNLKMFP